MRSFSRARLRDIRLPGSSSPRVFLARYSTDRTISAGAVHISSRATTTTQRAASINRNPTTRYAQLASTNISRRALHLTSSVRKEIDNPPTSSSSSTTTSRENHKPKRLTPAKITTDEYHRLSNDFLEDLLTKLEDLQEEKEKMDVDFAVSFFFPPFYLCVS